MGLCWRKNLGVRSEAEWGDLPPDPACLFTHLPAHLPPTASSPLQSTTALTRTCNSRTLAFANPCPLVLRPLLQTPCPTHPITITCSCSRLPAKRGPAAASPHLPPSPSPFISHYPTSTPPPTPPPTHHLPCSRLPAKRGPAAANPHLPPSPALALGRRPHWIRVPAVQWAARLLQVTPAARLYTCLRC